MVNVDSDDIVDSDDNLNNFNLQTKAYAKTYVKSLCVFMLFPRIYFLSAKSNPEEFLKNWLPMKFNLREV